MKQKSAGNAIKIAVLIAAALGFALVMYMVLAGKTETWDAAILEFFYSIRRPGLNTLVEGITYLGGWEAITIICLLLLVYPKTRFTYGAPVTAVALVTQIIKKVVKEIVARMRPEESMRLVEENGFSFPSGHSITSMAVYGLLFLLIRENMEPGVKKTLLSIAMLIAAFGIGLTRLYLGVHFPSDVLAGWCAAIASICGVLVIRDLWRMKKSETL